MTYIYSQTNRLDEPHPYMYTPFQGEELFRSYYSARMFALHRSLDCAVVEPDRCFVAYALSSLERIFANSSPGGGKKFANLLAMTDIKKLEKPGKVGDDLLRRLAKRLKDFTPAEPVQSLDLLHALLAAQFTNESRAQTKVWLDRLVQRFEVSKKIYESYPPGFRRGDGVSNSVRLYWLFALNLCLFYAGSNQIKFLSTFLKVNDLLCSLPDLMLKGQIPQFGFFTVLAAEIVSVQLLVEKKGISLVLE